MATGSTPQEGWFWHKWELWMKLCFLLFCLIGLTFIIGITVRMKRYRRRQRAIKLKQQRAADKESAENVAEQQKRLNSIPFGIRALEKGIIVKDVWISCPNTPVHTPGTSAPTSPNLPPLRRESPQFPPLDATNRSSAPSSARSSSSTISHLEIPQPAHTRIAGASKARTPRAKFGQDQSAQLEASENESPDFTSSMRGKPAYQPHGCHQAKISGGFGIAERRSGMSAMSISSASSEHDFRRARTPATFEMSPLGVKGLPRSTEVNQRCSRHDAHNSIESLPFTAGFEES